MPRSFFKKISAAAYVGLLNFLFSTPFAAAAINSAADLKNLLCIRVFGWMFVFLIVISTIMALVGAYMYATSGGDSEKVSKATKTIAYAAIGIVVALAARGIPALIGELFGESGIGC
ncbi:MAG: hypothetical protein A3B25_01890 [Candidatus Ryanbacteria bacterium RIFCSPLOWO2_01_FULL_48_26]|uniref:TrbC/VIRB2 family protein n=1 Tax=Candidatus Ryanbacteria bacterium RIFCSPLOWO2_01_FULL_48_26 TaxID=1802126 RepID=A0A1G2GUD5_9BACT|nr:MAG: hypothetical protein A3B25_01890 [Candidatus Ryanbacteria bacterium RIFCSPLOWO2_01_FULL_48_26]